MQASRVLSFALLAFVPLAAVTAQEGHDAGAKPADQSSVAFLDAHGDVLFRIPRDEALDADAMQRALWIARLYERFGARAASDSGAADAKARMEARWSGLRGAGGMASTSGEEVTQVPAPSRATQGAFEIDGDFSTVFQSGTFVIFQPGGAGSTSGAAPMGAATIGASTSESDDAERIPGEIARAALVDGRFTITGEVDEIRPIYFYVLDAMTHDGRRMAPTKGQGFLLEPGRLSLTMDRDHKHAVRGGFFNEGVYGSWKNSQAYQDLQALLPLAFRSVAGESESDRDAFREMGSAIQSALLDVETEGRRRIALEHPDLLVRQLVIETAWLGGPWMLEGARGILALEPENTWAKAYVEQAEARLAQRGQHAQAADVGGRYLPFLAESLEGAPVSLSKTCRANRYVLLEFWASWCGPCRAEVPHLKDAYGSFHEQGFEIFAYTLDDDRGAWAKASAEEELPWINTGSGAKSDPVLLYAVGGVPANYLIDGETGRVVARNLRGDALREKLETLFAAGGEQRR